MKATQITLAAIALLSLLTWLWLRGMNTGAESADSSIAAINDLALAQSSLHRDLLSARVGMLRNCELLTRQTSALLAAVGKLQKTTESDAEINASVRDLANLLVQQERLTRQFKSQNALLQNSLASFGLFSARLSTAQSATSQHANALSTAMLRLTLDTSPTVVADVDARLKSISTSDAAHPPDEAAVVQALLAHAKLLRELLPKTDHVITELFALPSNALLENIRSLVMERRRVEEASAKRFRYVMYAISLLLGVSLVLLGIKLQARSRVLQRRATMDHLLAGLSMRLINSRPNEIARLVEQGLADLATCWQADRAYFLLRGQSDHMYVWSRSGSRFPAGWPDGAIELALRAASENEDVVYLRSVREMGTTKDHPPLPADLRGWIGVPSKGRGFDALLGFDFTRPHGIDHSNDLGQLRMAFDAIANVLERDLLERDRTRLETNLQQARRMETIGALASGFAHNFNNIIGAILGFAETANSRMELDARTAEDLNEIQRAGERARTLVGQILTFGRRNSTRRTPTWLGVLISESKTLLKASLPDTVEIITRENSGPVLLMTEAAQLQQVIMNVCNNAAQAMDLVGVIEITSEICEVEVAARLDAGEVKRGRYCVLSVSDSGRGMAPEVRERIFEPFFTTRMEGNGLGLATVREIVLEHDGALSVQSKQGLGTRFDIWLPCTTAPQPRAAEETTGEFVHRSQGHGETILVLEEDRERRLLIEEILAALSYEPVGFAHPADAATACLLSPTRFDAALLCSHSSAAQTNAAYIAPLRKVAPDLPIILATAAVQDMQAPELAGNGIAGVIGQRPTLAELAAALARCFKQNTTAVTNLSVAATSR